jgi:hypothetical protein
MLLKIDSGVYKIDLSSFFPFTFNSTHLLSCEAGICHYKLLAYLSSQLPVGAKVADFGTYFGDSAISLAYNSNVQVTTYDPNDNVGSGHYKLLPNITYCRRGATDVLTSVLDTMIIFVDIGNHESILEQRVLDFLITNAYKGIAIFDDIYLNDAMKKFWNSITLTKYDVTEVGHGVNGTGAGTGVVVFDETSINVIVDI